MYPPDTIPVPASIEDPMGDSPYTSRSKQEDQLHYKDKQRIQRMRSIYYGMVREVDDWMGEILTKLSVLGLSENTLVVFTSDHGEMFWDHGMHSKMIFYEGSVHVPLLMRLPERIKAGTVVEEPISSVDVYATILDYMEMPISESDGLSLRPFIEGSPVDHEVVSYSSGRDRPNYMIRIGALKLMMAQVADSRSLDALYDLEADPLEMRNLIVSPLAREKNRAQAKMMKARLLEWLKEHEASKVNQLSKRELF